MRRWPIRLACLLVPGPAFADGFGPQGLVLLLAAPLVIAMLMLGLAHLLSGRTRTLSHSLVFATAGMVIPVLLFHYSRDDLTEYTPFLNSAVGLLFEPAFWALGVLITGGLAVAKAVGAAWRANKQRVEQLEG